ncbi:MAG: tyrosine--tRNA ligase, partial [Cyanobacteria bacterium REEB65]|nr:tyrosine--tRNA ligase [Cyanobacteria bacterium REEB65]
MGDLAGIVDATLTRRLLGGAEEAFPAGALERKLAKGRPLRVKLGFDPTKPDLHLGHAVVLRGLRRFQEAGHQIVLIIGDFTAQLGDPTGKEKARPPLSPQEVEANAQTYLDQFGIIVDLAGVEIRRNSEWLAKLDLAQTLELMAKATVAQMLARENFAKRFERGDAIGLHEFLYPLLQGYDSVAIRADVELGGVDQRFNLLVGRDLQEAFDQEPQACITYPILEGTDGKEKMSKSLDNYIGLTMDPNEMYGRTMSVPDSLLEPWYKLAANWNQDEIESRLAKLQAGDLHPRDAKMALARRIVSLYHGPEAADRAEDSFVKQFQRKEIPADVPAYYSPDSRPNICQLLVAAGLAKSSSYAR